MNDRFDHLCVELECPVLGQRSTPRSCACHKTREQMMLKRIAELESEEVSEGQLHAAMDAFYPEEDWRRDLGCALESCMREMRDAIVAARRA